MELAKWDCQWQQLEPRLWKQIFNALCGTDNVTEGLYEIPIQHSLYTHNKRAGNYGARPIILLQVSTQV